VPTGAALCYRTMTSCFSSRDEISTNQSRNNREKINEKITEYNKII
jgi:hypothetical protein